MATENPSTGAETAESSSVATTSGEQVDQANQDGAQQQQQQQQRPSGWSMVKGFVIRCLIIYFISSFFRSGQTPTPDKTKPGAVSSTGGMTPASNIFTKGTVYDVYAYMNEQEVFTEFDNAEARIWMRRGLVYGDWTAGPTGDSTYTKSITFPTPLGVQNNGSIYLHMYVVKSGYSPDPGHVKYSKRHTMYSSKRLNKYKRKRFHTTVNLMTGKSDAHPDLIQKENESSVQILSHWHPNMTVCILDDHTPWTKGSVPQPLDEFIKFDPSGSYYYPVVYFNDYWNLNSDFQPVNDTVKNLNFTLTFHPISLFKWQMYAAQGMRNRWYSLLGEGFMPEETDEEQDSLKTMLVETNPYLLAMTIIVSIIHSVFEFLAFKNDIQFWKSRKSLEGLSVRSVFFNVFQSLIVVLYVLDNETNTVVRISVGIGLLIEIWKIKKVVDPKIDFEDKWFGVFPKLKLQDKSTYVESDTRKYDEMAFRYLSWLLFPLLACYCVYSLVYQEHKSVYSWILSMLYGFLLTFGFITMTPQLFINYKLKSVAHLPWRMLTYKALNTFIDDIFAFAIKMPTLYRIGCLRDDVIFFIYLYQKWIYPTDLKRVNEFGTTGDMDPDVQPAGGDGADAGDAVDSGDALPNGVSNPAVKGEADKKND